MKRKLLEKLIEWKDSKDRKPLLLEGARQVGKTHLLTELFGKEYFDNVIHINLQKPPKEIVDSFQESIDPYFLIERLELYYHSSIDPDKTLIVFDEVQDLPRALTSLKYFYEDAPEYHVVASGSLLGIFLHSGTSFPVGKVDRMRLEPLDFEEFLWAKGDERFVQHVKSHPEDAFLDRLLKNDLREYMFVGGMPEVVKSWVNEKNIEMVDVIQRKILLDYQEDFSKHPENAMAVRIKQVFDSLPAQFAKRNEKFVYGVVRDGARAREYELAIEWLVDAGIVRRVYRVERGDRLPLKAYVERNAFKLYFLDVGLFRRLAEIPSAAVVTKNAIFDEYNGLMAEQFVLQELSSEYQLYYWTRGATAEVDFVTQVGMDIVPIEVKSGENVHAKSLKSYRERYQPRLATRFSLMGLEENDGLLNIPLYKSFLGKKLIEKMLARKIE